MRYLWCNTTGSKSEQEMRNYKEAIYRREFENAMTEKFGMQMKKAKRFRSAFTTEQVNYLEKEFLKYPYIGNARRKDVSNVLNIPERAVKIWFQNRRMKEKKEVVPKESNEVKAIDVVDEQINTGRALSTNDPYSLPLLTANDEDLKPKGDKTVVANDKQQVPVPNEIQHKDKLITKPENQATVLKDARSSSTSVTIINPQEDKNKCNSKNTKKTPSLESENVLFKQEAKYPPLDRFSPKAEQSRFNPYMRVPSPKAASHCRTAIIQPQPIPRMKPEDSHVYLKGFYQPYIPPGNMIWKPINVAPVIPTGVPPMTIPNGLPFQQTMPKRSCNCDCHSKPYTAPMQFQQNSANPQVQYVIAAVPFQNPPKFQ